ncbi:Stb2 protein [Candida orthopsilosis Co 90-125]|uniref:Stb2 protein n=1 Tax=Candida orthopsilosis (strain 90-125) TaxID=1136231 RepID=H8X1B1_CANO9|nr:Stb2 protein [Candida orthopsilosis Co 90-125]CCG22151.1 Stb2 protein [Candida orthopsilosis Co 90-125]
MSLSSSFENLQAAKQLTQNSNEPYKKNSVSSTNFVTSGSLSDNPNDFITYLIPDFNAVKYFQKDFIDSNEFYLIEESEVTGFELYLVEQWVINRHIGTIVTAFTGNESSKIAVVKFTIIKKPTKYYPIRFQEYLTELIQNHSRMKTVEKSSPTRTNSDHDLLTINTISSKPPRKEKAESKNDVCFVTNLTSLPPQLNLLPVSNGDARSMEAPFIINSNLKRLQCTGRSVSLTTDKISDACEDKFRQMYKIYNVKEPVKFAVRELVNVVQTCLFYFDLLDGRYCTGLLCVKTEEAINSWWNLIGLPHFNSKPNIKAGVLPARTVAAIISLILSIRLRLQLVGISDVPKDPFDFENFMLSIGSFQRQYKLEKTRKLDMETMNKLFTTTNSRLMPTRSSNYFSPYGATEGLEEYELLTSPTQKSPNSRRMYGKRELKKLTNVMKTSVQDRIAAASNREPDDVKGKSGGIRNRIAKLADTMSPLDVETLDLDNLVKNYLVGKTLIKLFYGVQAGGTFTPYESTEQSKSKEKRRSKANEVDSHLYTFESLRDKIIQNSNIQLSTYNSRYALGFTKRFGLQSRKNMSEEKIDSTHLGPRSGTRERSLQSSSLVDSFLQIGDDATSFDDSSSTDDRRLSVHSSFKDVHQSNEPLVQFKRDLNRRNSWPSLLDKNEENLSSFVHFKNMNLVNPAVVEVSRIRPRSFSTTSIDATDLTMCSISKVSQIYLDTIDDLIKYENLRDYYFENTNENECVSNATLAKSFQLLNIDLLKVKNLKNQVYTNKHRVLETGIADHLNYNLDTLTNTIDRLSYETRIVGKKISELEENFKIYNNRQSEAEKRLERLIGETLSHSDMKVIFTEQQRKEFALKLTGDENFVECKKEVETMSSKIMKYLYGFFWG